MDTIRFRYIENGGSFDTVQQAYYIEDNWTISDQYSLSLGIRNEKFVNNNTCDACYVSIRAYLSEGYWKLLGDNIRERVLRK